MRILVFWDVTPANYKYDVCFHTTWYCWTHVLHLPLEAEVSLVISLVPRNQLRAKNCKK